MKIKLIALGVISSLMMSCQAEVDTSVAQEVSSTKSAEMPTESSTEISSERFSKLDQYLATLAEKDKVLGSFAIYEDGQEVYDKAYIIEDSKLVETEESYRYRIGSISKTFTSTLVFQQIEAGKLSLETTLSEFYPEIKNADQITIKMMLNHHSGIFNYTNAEDFMSYFQETQSTEAMVERIANLEPAFEPGKRGEYSNSNYLLLGYILESLTGKDYGELIANNIASPIGLEETYLDDVTEPEKNEVYSYVKGDEWTVIPGWDLSTADAAGAIVSTTHDLNMFFEALFDGKLISEQSLKTMIELEDTYGHGIFSRTTEVDGEDMVGYWHNGRIERFSSAMIYFPKQRLGVSVLLNADGYSSPDVFKTVMKTAFNQDIEIPEFKIMQLSEDQLKAYEGSFASDTHPLGITVMVNDGKLQAQAEGQGAFPLTAIDTDTFEFSGAGIEMKFDLDKHMFIIKQGGRADVFIDVEHRSQEPSVEVDQNLLKSYEGLYKADDFPLDIEIMVKEGKLYAQGTGQSPFALTSVSDTEFKFDLAGIVIKFDADNNQLEITQGGRTNLMQKD